MEPKFADYIEEACAKSPEPRFSMRADKKQWLEVIEVLRGYNAAKNELIAMRKSRDEYMASAISSANEAQSYRLQNHDLREELRALQKVRDDFIVTINR